MGQDIQYLLEWDIPFDLSSHQAKPRGIPPSTFYWQLKKLVKKHNAVKRSGSVLTVKSKEGATEIYKFLAQHTDQVTLWEAKHLAATQAVAKCEDLRSQTSANSEQGCQRGHNAISGDPGRTQERG